jgi:hypothetical protein
VRSEQGILRLVQFVSFASFAGVAPAQSYEGPTRAMAGCASSPTVGSSGPGSFTQRVSRHRSLAVFRGYIEDAGLFDDNAATAVGL